MGEPLSAEAEVMVRRTVNDLREVMSTSGETLTIVDLRDWLLDVVDLVEVVAFGGSRDIPKA
jgi:hypothetical protein